MTWPACAPVPRPAPCCAVRNRPLKVLTGLEELVRGLDDHAG